MPQTQICVYDDGDGRVDAVYRTEIEPVDMDTGEWGTPFPAVILSSGDHDDDR